MRWPRQRFVRPEDHLCWGGASHWGDCCHPTLNTKAEVELCEALYRFKERPVKVGMGHARYLRFALSPTEMFDRPRCVPKYVDFCGIKVVLDPELDDEGLTFYFHYGVTIE